MAMINVVYAMTKNVYPWILPSLRSLVEHNPDANVFILAEDDELPFALPVSAKIINVAGQTHFPESGINYHNAYTYINLLKVCLPSLLSDIDKVIYLDIDTIICDSLDGMWETDLTDKWFGACIEKLGGYHPFGEVYYNTGVMVINLEQMRQDEIEKDMVEYLNTVLSPYADQDAWDKYGIENDKIVALADKWNESCVTGYTQHPGIVHYCAIPNWYTRPDMIRVDYLNKYKREEDENLNRDSDIREHLPGYFQKRVRSRQRKS